MKKILRKNTETIVYLSLILIIFLFIFGFECSRNWTDSALSVKSDFMISREVTLKAKGQYRILGFVLEKPGTYQIPEYHAWEGSYEEPYRTSVFIPCTFRNRRIAEKNADEKAEQYLTSNKKQSKYVLDIEKLNKDEEWAPYDTIIVNGDNSIVIE